MKTTPCNVCGKPSQYGGCENCYYNTVGINEKVELGEKSLYQAIKEKDTAKITELEKKAEAGEIIRIV